MEGGQAYLRNSAVLGVKEEDTNMHIAVLLFLKKVKVKGTKYRPS